MDQAGTGPGLGPAKTSFCFCSAEKEDEATVEQAATPQEEPPETVTEPEQQPSEHIGRVKVPRGSVPRSNQRVGPV